MLWTHELYRIFKYDSIAQDCSNKLHVQGTMRSYAFSDREVKLANDAELDVICGFSIIDDDMRVIVIEGLAGVDLGMQSVYLGNSIGLTTRYPNVCRYSATARQR